MRDVEVTCKNCNQIFVIRQSEQEYFSVRKRPLPKYCPICRKVHYAKQAQERKQKENQEWQKKKAEDVKRYYSALKDLEGQFDIIPLEHVVPDPKEKILYIIGNGFDLMHGVRSSYYDFGNTIGKHSHIRFVLENYLESDDLWADFEGALATMNVEAMSQPFVLDTLLDAMDAYDEDAQAADFFAAAEMAAAPATELSVELMDRFTKWINSLQVHTDCRPLKSIIQTGDFLERKFLDFNYTEFIEELYGVPGSDVCYIHGCRRTNKGEPADKLVLGHQPQASDSQFDFEENWKGINLSGNRMQMIYDAQQVALREIVEADDSLTKHCNKIIDEHKNFFESLSEIDKVITIGHSLYPVDWDYFAEVIRQNKDSKRLHWYFGCFGNGDLERIQNFILRFDISADRVHIFRTDTISVTLNQENAGAVKTSGQQNKSITPEKQSEREKVIGVSENGRWRVCTCGNIVQLKDDKETVILSRIFSHVMNGAVFVDDQICFWVMRGIDKGVFFLRQIDGEWTYLGELEGIPNQGVITKRLHRILIDEGRAVFVYQSRVRGYSLLDGALVSNMAVRHAPERRYMGRDFTQKFQRIYKGDFY